MPSRGDLARYFIRKGGRMEKRKWIMLIVISIVIFGLAGYISLQSREHSTKPDPAVTENKTDIGVIDMNQVLKAHPKYELTLELQKELNTLKAEVENRLKFTQHEVMPNRIAVDEQSVAMAQDQLSKQQLIAKHAELNERLKQKETELRQQLNTQMEQETAVIDDEYMPEIFNLQLKMKTLQMTEEAFGQMQAKIQELQQVRNEKIYAKQKVHISNLESQMQAEQAKANEEFNAFAQQVTAQNQQLSNQQSAKMSERGSELMNQADVSQENVKQIADLKQQALEKEAELKKVQGEILDEATSIVAKLAVEKNLSVVINKVQVNLQGFDLTDLVIQAFNK